MMWSDILESGPKVVWKIVFHFGHLHLMDQLDHLGLPTLNNY